MLTGNSYIGHVLCFALMHCSYILEVDVTMVIFLCAIATLSQATCMQGGYTLYHKDSRKYLH